MLKYLLPISIALASASAFAKDYLEEYLPESAVVSISLDDFKAVMAQAEDGKLNEFFSASQKEKWDAELSEPFETEDGERFVLQSGDELSLANLSELLNGRLCASIVGFAPENDMEPSIVIMADFAGEADALRYLQVLDREMPADQVVLIEEPYAGVTLYTEEIADEPEEEWMAEYWTLVDGIAIEATSLELLKNVVDSIIDSRSDGLGSSRDFLRSMDIAGDSQIRFYANAAEAISLIQEAIAAEQEELPMNPLGLTMESIWDSLGLDSFKSFFFTLNLDGDNPESVLGVLYDERRGVLDVLAYTSDPINYPHWVPSDAVDANIAMIDFSEAFASFEALMNDMSPNFGGMFQLQLDNMKRQTGIDLRESLMKNFGKQFTSYSMWNTSETSDIMEPTEHMVAAVPLRDPQAFQNAVKGLTETFAPGVAVFSEREFLDYKIVTPGNLNVADAPFGYSLTNGHLFIAIGSVDLLERTLYRLQESEGGLWTQPHIVDALTEFPPNPVENAYLNLGPLIDQMVSLYNSELQSSLGNDMDFELPEINSDDLPYFVLSAGYVLEDAQITRIKILPKDEQ